MKYIFALSNPGKKYSLNYHNIGSLCAQHFIRNRQDQAIDIIEKEKYSMVKFADFAVVFSNVYMNLSFFAISPIYKMYKVKPSKILVLHDELMLPRFQIRLKKGGGNAGHNGLRSLSEHMGSEFHRLRIGIGHPWNLGLKSDVSSYVLSNIDSLDSWKAPFDQACEIISSWIIE